MKLNITAERIHKLDDRCKEITKNAAQNTKGKYVREIKREKIERDDSIYL